MKVKCDETRPACRNCVKLGYGCPGFAQRLRWSSKHETGSNLGSSVSDDLHEDRRARSHQDGSADGSGTRRETFSDSVSSDITRGSQSGLHELPIEVGGCPELALPPTWQPATTAVSDMLLHGNAAGLDSAILEVSQTTECDVDPSFGQDPPISRSLTHLPTMLIEHWFRFVCPMWSTFDSEINYNRMLARNTWSASGAVFFAMQAMSAACLLDSMPALIGMLPALRTQATAAIKEIMDQGSNSMGLEVTADLTFAVFALGTSSSWSSPAPMELPWLQVARTLLSAWQSKLLPQDRLRYAYFCQALTYWEMLSTISGLGSMVDKVSAKQQRHQARLRQALFLPEDPSLAPCHDPTALNPRPSIVWTRPNSWCGVSNEVIDIFGQVLALCRSSRQKAHSTHDRATASLTTALCDIAVAHELQQELLALDFGTLVSMEEAQGFSVETQDDKTPIVHLVLTAEAYRQAGLLQLHLTFSDLPKVPLTDQHGTGPVGSLSRDTVRGRGLGVEERPDEYVRSLSLQLLAILERIPAESGSRSMHSMLYLSAAAGLKFDTSSEYQVNASASEWNGLFGEGTDDLLGPSMDISSLDHIQLPHGSDPAFMFDHSGESASTGPSLSGTIARARQSILTRLSGLQQSVPQKVRDDKLQLVKVLWDGYDTAFPGCSSIHWLDLVPAGAGIVAW